MKQPQGIVGSFEHFRSLVWQGEGQLVEFKRKVRHPEKLLKEVSAFANADGGYLLLGVEDDGRILGFGEPEEEAYVMESAILRHMRPVPNYQFWVVPITGSKNKCVLFKIEPGNQRPYYVEHPVLSAQPRAFYRRADESIQASKELRDIMRQQDRFKGLRVEWGEKEKALLAYINQHGQATLGQFMTIAGVNKQTASRTLVLLAVTGILEIVPSELEDSYRAGSTTAI